MKTILGFILAAFMTMSVHSEALYWFPESNNPIKVTSIYDEKTQSLEMVGIDRDIKGHIDFLNPYDCDKTKCWKDFTGWIQFGDIRIAIKDVYTGYSGTADASISGLFPPYLSGWISLNNGQYSGDFHLHPKIVNVPIGNILAMLGLGLFGIFAFRMRKFT